jgi:uncharacterized protein (TIGR02266 family)
MSARAAVLHARRNARGTPIPPAVLEVKFTCHSVHDFVGRHAADVSRGGIFVRTNDLLPLGHPVLLDLQLADGTPLIAGEGTVFWSRQADPSRGAAGQAGLGVRFERLTPQSQWTLSRMLAAKAAAGDQFDDTGQTDQTAVASQQDQLAAAEWRESHPGRLAGETVEPDAADVGAEPVAPLPILDSPATIEMAMVIDAPTAIQMSAAAASGVIAAPPAAPRGSRRWRRRPSIVLRLMAAALGVVVALAGSALGPKLAARLRHVPELPAPPTFVSTSIYESSTASTPEYTNGWMLPSAP